MPAPPGGPAATAGARKRDPARSREAILAAATAEFCRHGLDGARVERIAEASRTNMRMLYHYFGSKADLYLAVLERVYAEIRAEEQRLNLTGLAPVEGMRRLVDFTFSFFGRRTDFVALMNNENLLGAQHLKRSRRVPELTQPLVGAIEDLLRRGRQQGVFRGDVDPVQLYVSIVAQSYFHVSNRHTLSVLFGRDLGAAEWTEARRIHARDLILAYLVARPDPVVAGNGR